MSPGSNPPFATVSEIGQFRSPQPSFVVDETDGGSFSKAISTPRYLKGSQRKANQLTFNVEQVGYKSLNSKRNETKLTYIVTFVLCKMDIYGHD